MAPPRKPGPSAARSRYMAAQAKRDNLLTLLRQGRPLKLALPEVGWSYAAYGYNRKEYPLWAQDIDLAKTSGRTLRRTISGAVDPDPEPRNAGEAFQHFVRKYFPDRRPHQPQQVAIVEQLENLSAREICVFNIWPEAGKTSTIEDYVCRTLAKDPNHRFRIVSEGQDLAKRIIGTCARRFTEVGEYPEFIARFGPFYEKGQERRGRPWAADQFTILQNSGGERDRSLVASGWTSHVYGSRIDTLILDDIQSQRNYGQSEEIFDRIRGTFLNRGLEMRTLIVGTRIGPGDFYERVLDAGLATKYVRMAAAGPEGAPTVPEFWDRPVFHTRPAEPNVGPCCHGFRECPRNGEKLTAREYMDVIRHQSGEAAWWSAYQQNPQANELTTFGALLERCFDYDRVYGKVA